MKRVHISMRPLLIALIFLLFLPIVSEANAYEPIPYEEILPMLEEYNESERMEFDVIGQSVQGRDLYEVVISNPDVDVDEVKEIREKMLVEPTASLQMIKDRTDFHVPILIIGGIHGNEFPGTDAVLELIERFAFAEDEETMAILDEHVLVFNVVNNPDGRELGTRQNANGFDLNRDHVTLSQPETMVNIDMIRDWNPMVLLDLHGFVVYDDDNPGLIEPTTHPHNPNYEHDLYLKWAMPNAEAMEEELVTNRDQYETDRYRNMQGTFIPYRDMEDGWDDYPPIFTPMYANHHGVYGHTLETPDNSLDGVRWMVDAVMGSLKFSSENKLEMTKDQLEIFKRGVEFEHVDHPEGYFPNAYVLPLDKQNASATIKGVNELLRHGLIVEKTTETFETSDQSYEEGTYVVRLDQAKRSLANVLLWDGEDISDQASAMYDVSAWNIPELWGFEATPLYEEVDATLEPITEPLENVGQLIGDGPYVLQNNSVESIQFVNELINEGIKVIRGEEGHFHIDATRNEQLESVVEDSNLYLETTDIPRDGSMIHSPKVAIFNDRSNHGTRAALNKMGYQVTEISTNDVLEHKLEDFDIVIANGGQVDESEEYKERVHEYVDAGGYYFAIGQSASSVAVNQLELSDATTHTGPRNSNGVVHVDYSASSVTSGYDEQDLGFVYNPIWFSDVSDEEVVARFADNDFFKAGFWQNSAEASGQPVVIEGEQPNVTIMGLEPGFRDHPEYLYRLMSNVIFTSSELELVTPERALKTIENLVDEEQIYYASTINRLTVAIERVIEEDSYEAARNYWEVVIWQWNLNSFSRDAYTQLRSDAEELLAYYES